MRIESIVQTGALASLAAVVTLTMAQTATPANNAQLLKMVTAKLPEQAILSSIAAAAPGSLDTSAEALIALRDAGATDAEIAALAATSKPTVSSKPNASQPISYMGGTITAQNGRLSFFVPGPFAGDRNSNFTFDLVLFNGQPALKARVWADVIKSLNFLCYATYGDLVIAQDQVTYVPYGKSKWGVIGGYSYIVSLSNDLKPVTYRTSQVTPSHTHIPNHVSLQHGDLYSYDWGTAFDKNAKPSPSQQFILALFRDYTGTLNGLLKAASIENPSHWLSSESQFSLPTQEQIAAIVTDHNQQIRALAANEPPRPSGAQTFANVMQGVANVSQGVMQANAASAAKNPAAAIQATMNYQQAVADTVNVATGASSQTIQPISGAGPAGNSPVNGAQASVGSGAGNSQYNGPNAQWVRLLLSKAGPYTCSPTGSPKVPANFSCQRDGQVYQAIKLAWGVECLEQTGEPDKAVQYSETMMQTLRTAKDLCGGTTCQTDAILSCSQLPR